MNKYFFVLVLGVVFVFVFVVGLVGLVEKNLVDFYFFKDNLMLML